MATNALLPVPIRAIRQSSSLWRGTMFHPLGSTSATCRGWQSSRWKNLHTSTVSTPSARPRYIQDRFARHMGCMFRAIKPQCCRQLNLQRRWSGSKRPDDQMDKPSQNPPSGPKKSPILSKISLSTHENIYTVPNILTFSRLVAAPLVGYFLVHDQHAAALSLFVYAGLTDLVDGYIARRYNLQTVVGTIIDPMADKLLMTIGVACLAVNGSIPVWLAVIILGRDVGLALSAIYYRWISLPPPKTMARYWDFSLPSAEVKPTGISKVNTALQLVLVGSAIALPVIPEAVLDVWNLREGMTALQYNSSTYDHRVWKTGLPVRSAVLKPHAGRLVVGWVTTSESRLLYLVAATTIWSGLSYVFSKDAVKILTKEEVQKRLARASGKKPS